MSVRRFNYITMHGILPFNFGMDYNAWSELYKTAPELVGSDPSTWTAEEIEEQNNIAKQETELHDRLMALPDEEFYAEVDRLKDS